MSRRTTRTRLLGLALALGLAVATAGCGEKDAGPDATPASSPSTTSPEKAPPEMPECSAVWVAGQSFPEEYSGCAHNGRVASKEPIICESGQFIYRHLDRFYATNGAPVRRTEGPLREDAQYQKVYESCTA